VTAEATAVSLEPGTRQLLLARPPRLQARSARWLPETGAAAECPAETERGAVQARASRAGSESAGALQEQESRAELALQAAGTRRRGRPAARAQQQALQARRPHHPLARTRRATAPRRQPAGTVSCHASRSLTHLRRHEHSRQPSKRRCRDGGS
jgi:hypothetical protein